MVALTIQVVRVLKGSLQSGELMHGNWTAPTAAHFPAVTGSPTGVWFLKGSPGSWTILPAANGDVPFPQVYLAVPDGALSAAYQISSTASVVDKIANEVAAALAATNGQSPLVPMLQIGALDISNSPVLQKAFMAFSASPVAALQSLALRGLIAGGNGQSLSQLAATPALQSDPWLTSAVCNYRSADAGSTSALGALASSGGPLAMRTCAAHALRSIHSPGTLAYLASILDSSTTDLQYQAVAGLASFANNLPIQSPTNTPSMEFLQSQGPTKYATEAVRQNFPSKASFERQKDQYISFWKAWWAAHQAEF